MRVLVGISGGVDSAVAARLLQQQGHEVTGCFLDLHPGAPFSQPAAQQVCEALGLPLERVEGRAVFDREVQRPFLDAYAEGRTPNPCVACNPAVKFRLLLREADRIGAERVATGHYARTRAAGSRRALIRGLDRAKDQSYFLYGLSQAQLGRSLLPLGDRTKAWTRRTATHLDLPNRKRPESQEICFVPDDDYVGYFETRRPGSVRSGEVVDETGRVLAMHAGIHRFTVGQRRGLGVAMGEPRYVLRIEPTTGRVVIGPREAARGSRLLARRMNWVAIPPPEAPFRAQAQIRHVHGPATAEVRPLSPDAVTVHFDAPQFAVTPGQALVLYEGDTVLGGGIIEGSPS